MAQSKKAKTAGQVLLNAANSVTNDVVDFHLDENPAYLMQAGLSLEVAGGEVVALGGAQVTGSKRAAATTRYSDGRLRLRGVVFDSTSTSSGPINHRWSASVRFEGAEYILGSFSAAAAAGLAWDAAAITMFGFEAATNFPIGSDLSDAISLYGPPTQNLELPGYTSEESWKSDFPRSLRSTSEAPSTSTECVPGSAGSTSILNMLPPSAAAKAAYHRDAAAARVVDSLLWLLGSNDKPPELPNAWEESKGKQTPSTPTQPSSAAQGVRTPSSARRRLALAADTAASGASPSAHSAAGSPAPGTELNAQGTPSSGTLRTKSGYRGVTYMPRQDRCWQARIFDSGKFIYLGVFRTAEEAAEAYDEAARKLKGYTARVNFPRGGESGANTKRPSPAAEGGTTGLNATDQVGIPTIKLPPNQWGSASTTSSLGLLVQSVLPPQKPANPPSIHTRGWIPAGWFLAPPATKLAQSHTAARGSPKQSKRGKRSRSGSPVLELQAVHTSSSPMRVRLTRGAVETADEHRPPPATAASAAAGQQHRRVQRVPGTSVVPLSDDTPPVFVHTNGFYKYAVPGSHEFDPLEVTSVSATYTHAPPPPFRVYPVNHDPSKWGEGGLSNHSKQYPGVCQGRPNSVTGEPQWFVAVDRVGTTRWLGPFPSEISAARGGDVARLVLQGQQASTSFHWDKGLFFAPEVASYSAVAPLSHPADSMYAALGDLKRSLLQATEASQELTAEDSGSSSTGGVHEHQGGGADGSDSDQDGQSSTPGTPKRRSRSGSASVPTAYGHSLVPLSSLTTSPHALRQALSPGGTEQAAQEEGVQDSSRQVAAAGQQYADARLRALAAAAFLDNTEAGVEGGSSSPSLHSRDAAGQWGQGAIKRV